MTAQEYLDKLLSDIRELDTGMDPALVRELVAEYERANGAVISQKTNNDPR